jgi:exo-beta-1,3-glucanase (GH17 family)
MPRSALRPACIAVSIFACVNLAVALKGRASQTLSMASPDRHAFTNGRQASGAIAGQRLSTKACLLENGLAYGPFRDGQSPDAGIYPTAAQVEEDLTTLSRITRRIRTYSAAEPVFQFIPQIATRLGMSVSQGIYLGPDRAENERQIAAAVRLAQEGRVDSLVVGNEILTVPGAGLAKSELIQYIRTVRSKAPRSVPVTTAEASSVWESNLDLAIEVDFLLVHIYPFWSHEPIIGAPERLLEQYRSLQAALQRAYPLRAFRIVVGETGWPSAGVPIDRAVIPNPENQRRYFEEFTALACANAIPFYFFSAFDEGWKWREGSSNTSAARRATLPRDRTFSGRWIGSSWGLFQSNGRLKPQFVGLFEQPPPSSRAEREILVHGRVAADYDLNVDSSHKRREWISTLPDELQISYPDRQDWGVVFITIGEAVSLRERPGRDFSEFNTFSIELRGEHGDETLDVAIKDSSDPDDGRERKVRISGLGRTYRTFDIPLSRFASRRLVMPRDLQHVYVVAEFLFVGTRARTVYARSIRYKP